MKLSIITINLNNFAGLQKTMQSVFEQTFTDYEYIIIDGGSTDGSEEFIKKHENKLAYWVSEKDKGIFNAMNKGLIKSKGKYILILNSGDLLIDNNSLQILFEKGENADIIYGDCIFSNTIISTEVRFPDKLTFKYFLRNSLPHSATIVHRKLYDTMGGYLEHLKIVSDWAFFLLAISKYNYTYKHVPILISNFKLGGVSSTELPTIDKERALILREYFPMFLDDYEELEELHKNLTAARKQFGFRLHNKLKKIIFKNH